MAHPLHPIIITSFVLCNDIIIWFLYYLLYLVALHVKLHDIRLSITFNIKLKGEDQRNYYDINNWVTPDFVNINKKKTKRLSPYNESEIWDKEELLSIVKYESYKRNKAILTLLWDFNARPHEITLMRIKILRLREKYGEGEVPYEAKTGTGPILLTFSFPYVRDWLNEHPFKNESNTRLVCNLTTGGPVKPNSIWDMMKQLKIRIKTRLTQDLHANDRFYIYVIKINRNNYPIS